MGLLKRFYPDREASDTYHIDFEALYREGYRGLIFDIDNTLVPHGAPADDRALALFRRLRDIGFRVCLLSNNDRARVEMFNRDIGASSIEKAGKPSRRGYDRALDLMGTSVGETCAVGDQIFTDIWGAHRAGITAILVGRLDPREEIQIVLKRYLEKIVLYCYHRRK